jgi:hypothetical protein
MLIPGQLSLLLERLFGSKLNGGSVQVPPFEYRIRIYMDALAYVEKDPPLFAYVLGHRNLVSLSKPCSRIDKLLLKLASKNPSYVPEDFSEKLPKNSRVAFEMEKIYARHRLLNTFLRAAE